MKTVKGVRTTLLQSGTDEVIDSEWIQSDDQLYVKFAVSFVIEL